MQTPATTDTGGFRPSGAGSVPPTPAKNSSPRTSAPHRARITTRIVLVYLCVGILWIVLSDTLLEDVVPNPGASFPIGMVKGIFFILVTGLLLWQLINRGLTAIAGAERQMGASESRFQAVFDNALDAMVLLDHEGRIVRVNNTCCAWLGRAREEAEGRFYYELSSPEARPMLNRFWQQMEQTERLTGRLENQRLTTAPASMEFSLTANVIPGHHLAIIRDVSQWRRYEREIEAREHKYQVLVEQAAEGIFTVDTEGRLLDVNTMACEILGYTREELSGLSVGAILVDTSTEQFLERMDALRAGVTLKSERQLRRKDGSLFPAEISTRMVDDGRLQSIVRDISGRKQTEQALVRRNEELNALYETTLGLITRLDPESLLQAIVNRAAALIGSDSGFLYVEDPTHQELVLEVATGSLANLSDLRLLPGDGLSGRVWQTGKPMTLEDYQKWPGRRSDVVTPHAIIAAPLRSGDRTVGVIGLSHTDKDKTFGTDATNLLERFGQMAALALQNARLYADAQQELAERKRSEHQLRLSEERLKAQYKGNPIPTYTWQHVDRPGEDFVLIDCNDAAHASIHGEIERMMGKSMRDFYAARPDIVADFEKCYREQTIVRREMDYTFVTTGERVYQIATYVYLPPDLVMLHADDISERKAYEQSLEQHAVEQARLLDQLMTAQEAERRRVSMDIHDGPLQSLGVSLMALDRAVRRCERGETEIVERELQALRASVAGTVAELRAVLADLSLDILKSAGLEVALRNHVEHFSDVTGIHVQFSSDLGTRLPSQLELLMYRLAQEALSNIRKHADATGVNMELRLQDNLVLMSVEDNGSGFDPGSVLREHYAGQRIGLRSMQQRIEDARGGMKIRSSPGEGTQLEFWCPVPEHRI